MVILGGEFLGNEAEDDGGVLCLTESNTTVVEGGHFESNEAFNGGVGSVGDGASVRIEGGNVTGNVAHNEGGAFSVDAGGNIQVGVGMLAMRYFSYKFIEMVLLRLYVCAIGQDDRCLPSMLFGRVGALDRVVYKVAGQLRY